MEDQSPLSELCSVCYIEKPKYRCPGCKAQTCSLGCYKRHQQRASCSGKRDPGAYLKKSQLATPSGLDQDYNYLKGVERNINHAGQDAHQRGIGVRSAASRNVARGWRVDSVLQRYLTENRITIDHAPTGMSRQKDNKTRPTKSNRIVWTTEWINAIGARSIHHDCAESDTISSLYSEICRPKASKRKIEGEEPSKQPKRGKVEVDIQQQQQDRVSADSDQAEVNSHTDAVDVVPTKPEIHFYLLKSATSHSKVLIQLNSQATLTDCLRDQTVQEYPTIVALDCPPQSLKKGYILYEDYKKSGIDNETEVRQGGTSNNPTPTSRHTEEVEVLPAELDPQSILEMLKRDVRR